MLKSSIKLLILAVMVLFMAGGLNALSDSESFSITSRERGFQKEQNEVQEGTLQEKKDSELTNNTGISIYTGYYDIRDERFTSIYAGRGHMWSFGVSRRLFTMNSHQFFVFLDFRFFSKKGQATLFKEDTKFLFRPISLGGAYLFVTKIIIPFAELGFDYNFYREESTLRTTSGSTLGLHAQCGIFIPLPSIESVQIKLYTRYSGAKTTENNLDVELGGLEYGIGLVYGFNL